MSKRRKPPPPLLPVSGKVTVPELKTRGWTEALIRDHLGEPDAFKVNPHYSSGPPMRLYYLHRVEWIEAEEFWPALMAQSARRKGAAKRAVETKRANLLAHLETLSLSVPRLLLVTLFQHACDHYNRHKEAIAEKRQDWDFRPASLTSDLYFLSGIAVNYLRHDLSHYEEELAVRFGRVSIGAAYVKINRKVYAAIAEVYPELAAECARQMEEKTGHHLKEAARNGTLEGEKSPQTPA